ncbi:MAG: glycosyltransferase family 2 protein, partial [Actinobacteria bacterium]|nr:glycosyltransferase family 2 protein [Actinomycetota bacterium]
TIYYINLTIRILFWLTGFWFLFKIPFCSNIYKKEKESKDFSFSDLKLSVIIPARNEEKILPLLFDSLKRQTVSPYEIILVNDQSSDGTAQVAKNYGAKLINIENIPEGWLGKPWACHNGALNSSGNILLFLDADTKLHHDGLEKLLFCYLHYNGVISVQPYHRIKKLYENFASFFNLVLMGSMNVFTPRQFKVKPIGAFGPCLLCDRKSYLEIGGHESAKGEVLEDLEIGKKFIKHGNDVYCFGGKGTIDFRMYPDGVLSLVNGFAKGFIIGAKSTSIVNLFLVIFWIAGSFYPVTLLIGLIFDYSLIDLLIGISFYIAYVVQTRWMLSRIGSFSIITSLFFPVFIIFFILIFFWSLIAAIFKINIKWKDRHVSNNHINRKKK